jgi:hypothetical protein
LHVEVAEPPDARGTLLGVHETAKPTVGEIWVPTFTVPENPPRLARLRATEKVELSGKLIEAELEEMLKSTTSTVNVTL